MPSEADIDPLCGSTKWSISNQRGFEWIYEKKKLHQKVRERKNPPAWRCFTLDLSWWHHRCLWRSWIQWWILWIGVYSQCGPWCKGPQVGSKLTTCFVAEKTAARFWTSTHSYEMTQQAFHTLKCQLLAELEIVLDTVTSKYTLGRYGPQS